MIRLPGIVLIDDSKEDLEQLHDNLIKIGYPCFPIHYKNDDEENQSGIDHININIIKPRIIITDLNLQEHQINPKNFVGPIAEVLKKLNISGPYLLYFWTKNNNHANDVMKIIFERYKDDIPLPLHYGVIDKAKFKASPDTQKKSIENLITENSIFNALFSWENKISIAAQNTTDSLFKLATPESSSSVIEFQSKVKDKLETILAIIGNETIGIKNAKEFPGSAIELGLEPVLHDHIHLSSNVENSNAIWQSATRKIGCKQGSLDIKAYLNSFYHIEESVSNDLKNKRGYWVEFNSEYFSNNTKKLEKNLGRKIKTILFEEFLNCKEGDKALREEAWNATTLGFIELSAECDQAQRKTKLNRYFLSVMIPIEYEALTYYGAGKRESAHAGIYRLPNVIIKNKEYIVKISFMYQIGIIPNANKWLGKPIFRLKEQILSDISYRASQHITRPGIIRFD
ncbi:hypothetical protein [Providencia sp. PROV038]|uniref:hypothetical protein n=1 Tax=Providencia sp. PROV038 TaxID=2949769 RepID=UPI00234A8772|nr:hypothetical protein [Providencia sp. PROV038]